LEDLSSEAIKRLRTAPDKLKLLSNT